MRKERKKAEGGKALGGQSAFVQRVYRDEAGRDQRRVEDGSEMGLIRR
jgi:hypothetical protein